MGPEENPARARAIWASSHDVTGIGARAGLSASAGSRMGTEGATGSAAITGAGGGSGGILNTTAGAAAHVSAPATASPQRRAQARRWRRREGMTVRRVAAHDSVCNHLRNARPISRPGMQRVQFRDVSNCPFPAALHRASSAPSAPAARGCPISPVAGGRIPAPAWLPCCRADAAGTRRPRRVPYRHRSPVAPAPSFEENGPRACARG